MSRCIAMLSRCGEQQCLGQKREVAPVRRSSNNAHTSRPPEGGFFLFFTPSRSHHSLPARQVLDKPHGRIGQLAAIFMVYFIAVFSVAADRIVKTGRDKRRSYRHVLNPRMAAHVSGRRQQAKVLVHDLTVEGALISVDAPLADRLSAPARVRLDLPVPRGTLSLDGTVRAVTIGGGRIYLHVQFGKLSRTDQEKVDEYLFAGRTPGEARYDEPTPPREELDEESKVA